MKIALTACLFTPCHTPSFLNPLLLFYLSPNSHSLTLNPKSLVFYNSFQTMSPSTTPSTSPPAVEVRENIDLTDKERQIFDRLRQVLRHFNLRTQLRVAGGWVRDKLLGKECYDIDIAFDNMLGREFCEKVNEYLIHTGKSPMELSSFNGIADLRSGKIVTSLPPRETFLDDPLRVLRAIRFGARFEFILDEELIKAASEYDVKDAIAEKISRVRIGHEIDLMISGNQPVKAMTYLSKLLLFGVVFSPPPNFEPPSPEGHDRLCIAYIDAAWRFVQLIGDSSFHGEQKRLALYAALFLPFKQTVYRDNKSKEIPVSSYIFRNSLKLKSSDAETVVSLHNSTEKFISLIPFIISHEEVEIVEVNWKKEIIDVPVASQLRILIGLLLQEIKDFWRVALLLSTLLYPNNIDSTNSSVEHFKLDERRELFKQIEDAIIRQGLDKIWKVKPLVNGKEIMSVLQLKTGGPLVREWQQKMLEWQLAHPSGSAKECVDWMRESQSKRARTD